jgi:hypothetical protein
MRNAYTRYLGNHDTSSATETKNQCRRYEKTQVARKVLKLLNIKMDL